MCIDMHTDMPLGMVPWRYGKAPVEASGRAAAGLYMCASDAVGDADMEIGPVEVDAKWAEVDRG